MPSTRIQRTTLCAILLTLLPVEAIFAQDTGEAIAERFETLTASTQWQLVREFEMRFDTFHPQGMTIVGDRIYVSSVEVIDRREERGRGHLFETDMEGNLLRRIQLGEGPAYHPGGIDFDGERIWVPVSEYKPDSRALVYAVDPAEMTATRIFDFADHLGGILRDPSANALIANSWGSRRFYRWDLRQTDEGPRPVDAARPVTRLNPSHFVDYQDGQWLPGTHRMICGGLRRYRDPGRRGETFALGGLALIDTRDFEIVHEVPVPLWDAAGLPMTQNPFYVQRTKTGLHVYFMPADTRSTVYVYEPQLE